MNDRNSTSLLRDSARDGWLDVRRSARDEWTEVWIGSGSRIPKDMREWMDSTLLGFISADEAPTGDDLGLMLALSSLDDAFAARRIHRLFLTMSVQVRNLPTADQGSRALVMRGCIELLVRLAEFRNTEKNNEKG